MIKILLLIVCMALFAAAAFAGETAGQRAPRILIAFFSHTNNTRTVAEEIQRQVGGDLFHIATSVPYPQDHQQTVDQARRERDSNARPELAATIPVDVMNQYDIVFIGYPNWWMTMPMAVHTFLDQYDLTGKTIAPFCTHGGSGLSNTVAELGRMQPGATVLEGLAISGRAAGRSQGDIGNWLRRIGLVR